MGHPNNPEIAIPNLQLFIAAETDTGGKTHDAMQGPIELTGFLLDKAQQDRDDPGAVEAALYGDESLAVTVASYPGTETPSRDAPMAFVGAASIAQFVRVGGTIRLSYQEAAKGRDGYTGVTFRESSQGSKRGSSRWLPTTIWGLDVHGRPQAIYALPEGSDEPPDYTDVLSRELFTRPPARAGLTMYLGTISLRKVGSQKSRGKVYMTSVTSGHLYSLLG